jgi:hypothetical protein
LLLLRTLVSLPREPACGCGRLGRGSLYGTSWREEP